MQSRRRGSLSVHRSEKTPGSKYSSTSGLSPRGHLERQGELHASTQDEAWRSCPQSAGTLRLESEIRGSLRFLPQLEMRPSSNAPSPVESREAPPTSSFPGFSEPPYLPEQAATFQGGTGAGAIFRMNSLLSAAGVPQVAGVHGDCIAGGGYMPIISDVVYMTEQAYMEIGRASLVKGGKSQTITSLDIGGPDVHVHLSRCADHRVPDDAILLDRIRAEVAKLPGPAWDYYRYGGEAGPPRFDPAELGGLFPADHRMGYDVRQVLARL